MTALCSGCGTYPSGDCLSSFSRNGLRKVHWECWSHCNLRCGFCYRTMSHPLGYADADRLLHTLKGGGIEHLVFGGGDPTLREDLPDLAALAKSLDITPVIHTNAQHLKAASWEAFRLCDHIGLSIDSADPDVHDTMRGRRGNHGKVLRVLEKCCEEAIRVSVRTVVSAVNADTLHRLGPILAGFPCIETWRLLEFTPIELGWQNKSRHFVPTEVAEAVFHRALAEYSGPAHVDLLKTVDKIDAYLMVSAAGFAYGVTSHSVATGSHRYVGSLLTEHLAAIAGQIRIEPVRHARHLPYQQDLV